MVCFVNTYPLDSDLSGGERYPTFEQLGPDSLHFLESEENGNVIRQTRGANDCAYNSDFRCLLGCFPS